MCVKIYEISFIYMCRCIRLDGLTNAACRRFNQASQNVIFNYATEEQFDSYIETLDGLEELLDDADADEVCQQAAGYIICNYVFIPCNLTTGNPRPICTVPCDYYFNVRCSDIFAVILRFSTIIDYPLMNNCPNTLSHLAEFGFSLLSDNFADDCIDIAGMCILYVPCAMVSTLFLSCNYSHHTTRLKFNNRNGWRW